MGRRIPDTEFQAPVFGVEDQDNTTAAYDQRIDRVRWRDDIPEESAQTGVQPDEDMGEADDTLILQRLPMLSISHVLCFSFLLSFLLGFYLISSEKDELRGISGSLPPSLFERNFLCR